MKEAWLQLLDQGRSDGQCHEYGEQSRLHVNITVAQVPESERIEEACPYVEHKFSLPSVRQCIAVNGPQDTTYNCIIWRPPVGDK